jgi:urea transport system substrate-binding protein
MPACPPRETLERLALGTLGPDDEVEVASHLDGCETCRDSVMSMSRLGHTVEWQESADARDASRRDQGLPDALKDHPRYRVTAVLVHGGMGAVYKAEHKLLERPVVLKVIRPDLVATASMVQRFHREAKLAARLAHPNVVAVYEAEAFGPSQMLVMEFVEGVSLAELVKQRGLLPVPESCELIRQAAVGLQYIHDQELVHRDIKPQNVMVSYGGQVKILDLGLATLRSNDPKTALDLTGERQFLGSVDYAAPEQWESSRDVDIRADIYSLGCTFYYLLAGEAPFPNKRYTTLMQQMWAHGHAPLPPIRDLRPDLPDDITEILGQMLAKDRDERFACPGDVATALAPFTEDCDLAEFVRTARRTTTSTRDLSRISSIRKSRPPAPRDPAIARRRLALGALVAAFGLLAGCLAIAFGPGNGRRDADRKDRGPATARSAIPATTGNPIKVGVLHSLTGTMAISERPVVDATLLAVEEINRKGGVLGRRVEAVIEDGGSDDPTFAARAEKLIARDKVCTVFGCWTSASRKTALPVFEKHNHLLVYPVQYEGLEQSPNIVYTGAAPNQQIIPAIKWCVSTLKKRKFFLVGSDYVFPRAASAIIHDQAARLGVEIVGEAFLPLGGSDTRDVVRQVVAAAPDAILNTINGDSNVAFFRTLRAAGITPERVPTISFSISEVELSSLSTKDLIGDYAAWNYFQSLDRPQNREFVQRFHARYGAQRVISDPMEAAYIGVHLWSQAVAEAGVDDVSAIRLALRHQAFEAPEGLVRVDPETQHTLKSFRIGRITRQSQFEVVYDPRIPIAPMPYPDTRSRGKWDEFLLDLHMHWGGQWAYRGMP